MGPSGERPADVVLVGGGHSHVQILRRQLMEPLPGARLTLVVDRPIAIYSGMVPGFVSGQYPRSALEIDLRPLARRAGARVVHAAAVGVDPESRRVLLRGRPPLHYDLASLNVGSTVSGLDTPGVRQHAVPTRPIAELVERFDAWLTAGAGGPAVVVGAGAGGVELAFCLRARLASLGCQPAEHPITLVSTERPLHRRPERLSRRVLADAADRGIRFVRGRVTEVTADAVLLEGGASLSSRFTVWVAGAAALPWLADCGLPVDARGYVRVRDTLEVLGTEGLLAAGDCAVLESWPQIPKAGVYAVRQGPPLADNLRRLLEGRPPRRYRPQRDFLTLLNYGDGQAVGSKRGLTFGGRWVFALKDRIDRRFMERFQVLDPEGRPEEAFERGMSRAEMAELEMVCGGCAAKVGQTPLSAALVRLPPAPADDTVVLGLDRPDDVFAVSRGGELLVQNVDAFTAFVDDPWLVGRVAALNALSDLHAKGVTPRYAAALVNIPSDQDPEEVLFQVLSGARRALDADGVTLLGGHTTTGAVLSAGFAITGFAPDRGALVPADGLAPGDVLVLSRALGTGVLLHADMAGRARGPWVVAALEGMLRGNGPASRAAAGHPLSAGTDVTGFGLAGHLLELLRASGVSAVLDLSAVPLLPGVAGLLARGERSTFHHQNREVIKVIRVERTAQRPALEALFDPQTSGGLLLGLPAEHAAALIRDLHQAGEPEACLIGEVVAAGAALLTVR